MKKTVLALTMSIVLIAFLCASGCALKAQGYGVKPSEVQPVYAQQQAPMQNTALEQKMDTVIANQQSTNNVLRELASAIRGEKITPVITKSVAKKPEQGVFSRNTQKAVTPQKIPVKKAMAVKGFEAEFRRLKTRVALLEDQKTDTGAGAIYFKSAASYLSPEAKTWLEKNIVQCWFAGQIDITDINAYASMTKPKNPNITNMDYAKQRAIAVQHYLGYRGVQTEEIKINVKGPTTRFGNNLNVTVVWNEVQNEPEQKTKKEERKQYQVDP